MQNVKLLKREIFSAGWTDVTHSLMAFGGVIDSTPIYLSAFCCARARERASKCRRAQWMDGSKEKRRRWARLSDKEMQELVQEVA